MILNLIKVTIEINLHKNFIVIKKIHIVYNLLLFMLTLKNDNQWSLSFSLKRQNKQKMREK